MIQIILLIVGIVYLFRLPKLRGTKAEQYPEVPEEKFKEWKDLELRSVYLVLWAGWGLFVIELFLGVLLAAAGGVTEDTLVVIQIIMFVLFFILLILASIAGSKAKKLRTEYGMNAP